MDPWGVRTLGADASSKLPMRVQEGGAAALTASVEVRLQGVLGAVAGGVELKGSRKNPPPILSSLDFSACCQPVHTVLLAARLLCNVILVSVIRLLALLVYCFVLLIGSSCSTSSYLAYHPARPLSSPYLLLSFFFSSLLLSSFSKRCWPKVAKSKVATP